MTLVDVLLGVLLMTLVPALWRMVVGPEDADRAVATDLVFFVFIAAVALLALRTDTPALIDVVVVATLTGFLATVALARLVDRSRP
ncbi:monovalent cation/H+ antiporter complex subunit F [Arthrobacter subterraneus]|uniref:monovalent cation/H+ antiporter complex subunit F n=1 Tax=Arthrobacter subterraneus TaxID=335973 RepID=UPI0037F25939